MISTSQKMNHTLLQLNQPRVGHQKWQIISLGDQELAEINLENEGLNGCVFNNAQCMWPTDSASG